MYMRKKVWVIVAGVVAVIGIYFIVTYNSLVKKEEYVKQSWSNLQNTYQRRNDLIPSLIAVVKGSSEYEKSILSQLAEARARAAQVSFPGGVNFQNYQLLEQAQGQVSGALNRTLAVVEN